MKIQKSEHSVFSDAKTLIKNAEGFSSLIYIDTLGNDTIGYGFDLADLISKGFLPSNTRTITPADADLILDKIINTIFYQIYQIDMLDNIKACYNKQYGTVQAVFIDMIYNLGFKGFSEFVVFLSYMNDLKYNEAVIDLTNSLWYSQVKQRAIRNCFIILNHSDSLYLI